MKYSVILELLCYRADNMDSYMILAAVLLVLQAIVATICFGRMEAALRQRWWMRTHKYLNPWKIPGKTPREIMSERSIPPLDILNLHEMRIDCYGQLKHCPSLLYYLANKHEKESNAVFKAPKRSAEMLPSESDVVGQLVTGSADAIRKKLVVEMERHANKLRRRYELETYNGRRSNFKRFATDRMNGLGHHRYAVDPVTLKQPQKL
ncbi:hypothetical protein RB195_016341 [Necator americanus]|uniref:Uncharacterized protein n=1 Tax=Necator americanus TaxID=51031 RepID=A0ABR1E9A4_NECAM